MAPRKSTKSTGELNDKPCGVCGVVIARKTDVPRHARLHVADKSKLLHYCPFEDCEYTNLQKSNLTTHIRTHTGEKSQRCLECNFTTSDPGSLTRHRKRAHGYVPKKRNLSGRASTAKQSKRHSPYSRGVPAVAEMSSSSTGSNPTDFLAYPSLASALNSDFSYPWDKEQSYVDFMAALEFDPLLSGLPNPKQLSSAADAGHTLEGDPSFAALHSAQDLSSSWASNIPANFFVQSPMGTQPWSSGASHHQTSGSSAPMEFGLTVSVREAPQANQWSPEYNSSCSPYGSPHHSSNYSASSSGMDSPDSYNSPPFFPASGGFAPLLSEEQLVGLAGLYAGLGSVPR